MRTHCKSPQIQAAPPRPNLRVQCETILQERCGAPMRVGEVFARAATPGWTQNNFPSYSSTLSALARDPTSPVQAAAYGQGYLIAPVPPANDNAQPAPSASVPEDRDQLSLPFPARDGVTQTPAPAATSARPAASPCGRSFSPRVVNSEFLAEVEAYLDARLQRVETLHAHQPIKTDTAAP